MTIIDAAEISIIDRAEGLARLQTARGPEAIAHTVRDYLVHRCNHLGLGSSARDVILPIMQDPALARSSPGLDLAARIAAVGTQIFRLRGPECLSAYWMWALGDLPPKEGSMPVQGVMLAFLSLCREGDRPGQALVQAAVAQLQESAAYEARCGALFQGLPEARRLRFALSAHDAALAFRAFDGQTYTWRSIRWRRLLKAVAARPSIP